MPHLFRNQISRDHHHERDCAYELMIIYVKPSKYIGRNPQADDDDAAGSAPEAKSGYLIAGSM